jgi:hypothetical protein
MLETIIGIGGLVGSTVLPLADRIFGAAGFPVTEDYHADTAEL